MDSACFSYPLNYYTLSTNSYLYPVHPFHNNYYYVVYPSSTGEDYRETFSQTSQKTLLQPKRVALDERSMEKEASELEDKQDQKNQKNLSTYHKNSIDQEFQVRERTKKKGILYKKKNTESNIINQVLSFLNTERSFQIVFKMLDGSEEMIRWFYRIMATIKKVNKRYANRKYLRRLIEFAERSEFHRAYLKEKKQYLTLDKFRTVLRKVVFYFIRQFSYLSLMTSSKIYKETLRQHFWRKKQIEKFLFDLSQKNE